MSKVTIGVILFGTKYLKQSLPSLIRQDYENIEFIFRDQEKDKWTAYKFVKTELPEIFEKVKLTKEDNLFHSGGHNAIINEMSGQYYFCCSNDMLYPSDFVSKMVKGLEENSEFTLATPKLMRWDYENNAKTDIIDSLGIGVKPWHHFYDIGQGEQDKGQYDELKEVFGASGAMSVFSKKALESIKYTPSEGTPEYFDNFMHYKNDCDLSYRLRWAGNRALLVQDAEVYHDRQAASDTKKSLWTRQSSFFGEKLLMAKNLSPGTLPLKGRILTAIYHFLKTTYLLVRSPQLFKEYSKIKKLRPAIEAKKRAITKKISVKKMAKFFT